MSHLRKLAFASVSLIVLSSPALAQNAAPAPVPAVDASGNEIIVSARRRDERLQDVPKTVDAVNADALRKNNIQRFDEISSIVPGINLQQSGNGLVQNATMRGVSFDVDSGLPAPTVQFYLNDANIQSNWVFQSMYDLGQIEVLRGPQGTLRGRSSPSGSITVSTKLPDLYKIGGYGQVTGETGIDDLKEDYALNLPIVEGRLAVRIAGTVDDYNGQDIKNVNRSLYPTGSYNRTWSERASVRAEPIDALEINLMYQRLAEHQLDNVQTESTCLIDPSVACNAQTGPSQLIRPGDRESSINGQRAVYQNEDIWNGRADLHVLGQKISYVGQFALQHLIDQEPQDGADFFNSPAAAANSTFAPTGVPVGNYAGTANPYQKVAYVRSQYQSHEIRIANEARIAGIFDYVAGFNTVDAETDVTVQAGGDMPASQLMNNLLSVGRNGNTEVSWFGNLTAHPTEKLELSGGARYIIDKQIANGVLNQRAAHTIWTASVSYHFTPSVMGYVNAGSSFRQGGQNQGLLDQPESFLAAPLTNLPQFTNIKPETSKSYEIGAKTQFFNKRLTLNIDYYHQDFHNFQYISTDYIYAVSPFLAPAAPSPLAFLSVLNGSKVLIPPVALGTANVPAKVDGVEGDINYRYARDGNIGGSFSYADGRVTGGALVPCAGNIADLSVTHQVNTCPGGPTSNTPRFSASLHADYAQPINDRATGFLRSQLTYNGATPNNPADSPYDKQHAYALLNLYAGVRSPDGAWELTFFVKNVANNQTRLQTYGGNFVADTAPRPIYSTYGPATNQLSNYVYITTPPPREFGATLRYAFGSR